MLGDENGRHNIYVVYNGHGMAVRETYSEVPSILDELGGLDELASDGLVILPERVIRADAGTVATFRADAQELRVRAAERGLVARLAAPDGASLAVYREHAADWVLPLLLGVPASVIASLVADIIGRRLKSEKPDGPVPTVRFRQVDVGPDGARLREIEGPADEVVEALRVIAAGDDPPELPGGESQ